MSRNKFNFTVLLDVMQVEILQQQGVLLTLKLISLIATFIFFFPEPAGSSELLVKSTEWNKKVGLN